MPDFKLPEIPAAASSPKVLAIVGGVIVVIVVVVVVYYKWKQSKDEPLLISSPVSINSVGLLEDGGTNAPLSTSGREFTYSFWMFARDWGTNYGLPKCLLYRGKGSPTQSGSTDDGVAAPSVWLYPKENRLMIRVSTFKGDDYDTSIYPDYDTTDDGYTKVNPRTWNRDQAKQWFDTKYTCDIENIPLQRWVNVSIVLWDRTLDVYINGKLVRSCILPGVVVHDSSNLGKIYVGPGETVNGYISRFKYYKRAITPTEAYKLYKKGPLSASYWWSAQGKKLKITFSGDD
jgi:hypothetical protein